MMRNLKSKLLPLLPCLGLIAGIEPAEAGAKRVQSVSINVAAQYATGAIGTVRNSSSTVEYIGCYLTGTVLYQEAVCYARNQVNTYVSCSTRQPNVVAALYGITSDSLITFSWMSDGVTCYNITIATDSRDAPKVP